LLYGYKSHTRNGGGFAIGKTIETKLGFLYFPFFPVKVELCVDCHGTIMLLTWEFLALSTGTCTCVDTFDVRAFMLLSRASFAALHKIKSTSTTEDTASTNEALLNLQT